jgi:hypothetical protein
MWRHGAVTVRLSHRAEEQSVLRLPKLRLSALKDIPTHEFSLSPHELRMRRLPLMPSASCGCGWCGSERRLPHLAWPSAGNPGRRRCHWPQRLLREKIQSASEALTVYLIFSGRSRRHCPPRCHHFRLRQAVGLEFPPRRGPLFDRLVASRGDNVHSAIGAAAPATSPLSVSGKCFVLAGRLGHRRRLTVGSRTFMPPRLESE